MGGQEKTASTIGLVCVELSPHHVSYELRHLSAIDKERTMKHFLRNGAIARQGSEGEGVVHWLYLSTG